MRERIHRIIFGQVSTLIALESTWCRGYMMLQTEEHALRQGLLQGFGYEGVGGDLNFRELNHVLGETTNLIWGAFKNRYIPPKAFAKAQTQVPIVINHQHKYITFGSPDPQLCIRYQLRDKNRPDAKPQEHTCILAVYKGAIAVNIKAERFVDESISYKLMGDAVLFQPEAYGYQIFDATVMAEAKAKGVDPVLHYSASGVMNHEPPTSGVRPIAE